MDAYNATDPRELRRRVRKRDRGVCRDCGIDTNRLRREVQGRGRAKKLRELGFLPRRSLWELDHVVPLIEGGGHDADNLQTLCVPCHRKKTAAEAKVRAVQRRDEREEQTAKSQADRLEELLERADATNARIESFFATER